MLKRLRYRWKMRRVRFKSRLYANINPMIPSHYHDTFWLAVAENIGNQGTALKDYNWSTRSLYIALESERGGFSRPEWRAWISYLEYGGSLPKSASKWRMYEHPIGPRRPIKPIKIPLEVG